MMARSITRIGTSIRFYYADVCFSADGILYTNVCPSPYLHEPLEIFQEFLLQSSVFSHFITRLHWQKTWNEKKKNRSPNGRSVSVVSRSQSQRLRVNRVQGIKCVLATEQRSFEQNFLLVLLLKCDKLSPLFEDLTVDMPEMWFSCIPPLHCLLALCGQSRSRSGPKKRQTLSHCGNINTKLI